MDNHSAECRFIIVRNWVALTANAFAADREACEAAGMDGFLAKPITLDILRAVLKALPEGDPRP